MGAGSPTWDKIYTIAPGVIGNILKAYYNSEGHYYHYDALGNLVFISWYDGSPDYAYEQEAYGNVKSGSQSGYHLTTKEYDLIPELYYFYQRWYDPVLGRFISTTSYPVYVEYPYVFVNNNPLSFNDINGEWLLGGIIGIIICGAMVVGTGGTVIGITGGTFISACGLIGGLIDGIITAKHLKKVTMILVKRKLMREIKN